MKVLDDLDKVVKDIEKLRKASISPEAKRIFKELSEKNLTIEEGT